ncbi:hypothetical protein RUM43_014268 [Polyplax serrata]|uniref:Uncharacterized protein n=1 Tax=Polyplax serrata TaxID=468196 RepID=A0AAN8S9J9_POLSC
MNTHLISTWISRTMLILQQTVDEEFDLLELLKMMEGQLQGMFPTKMEIVEHQYKTILTPSLANIFQLISYQEVKKLDNKGMPLLLNKSTLKQGQRGMDTKNQKVLIVILNLEWQMFAS